MTAAYFTDSCCDLPQSYAEERDLTIVPMSYRVDGVDYVDDYGLSLSYHDFYEKLRAGIPSSTSQVTSAQYEAAFAPALQAGRDVVCLAFSSALSSTYESALLAKRNLEERYPGRSVYVIDSLCASMGQGLLTHLMLNKRDEGLSTQEVVAWVEENKGRLCHWFTVYDLNHLKRGGRVSAAAAFFGTMLSVKPVLHVDDQGRLIPMEKVKGRARSVQSLFDHMKQTAQENQTIFISHGDSEADALRLKEMIQQEFGIQDIRINFIGPIVGSHSGPDTLALFFLGAPR